MSYLVLGIDPGNIESGFCAWDVTKGLDGMTFLAKENNEVWMSKDSNFDVDCLVIEAFQSYGGPVGQSVFDSVLWSGRFYQEAWARGSRVDMLTRHKVKHLLCRGVQHPKDSTVRQRLIDLLGEKPSKKNPNPRWAARPAGTDMYAAVAVVLAWVCLNYDLVDGDFDWEDLL